MCWGCEKTKLQLFLHICEGGLNWFCFRKTTSVHKQQACQQPPQLTFVLAEQQSCSQARVHDGLLIQDSGGGSAKLQGGGERREINKGERKKRGESREKRKNWELERKKVEQRRRVENEKTVIEK